MSGMNVYNLCLYPHSLWLQSHLFGLNWFDISRLIALLTHHVAGISALQWWAPVIITAIPLCIPSQTHIASTPTRVHLGCFSNDLEVTWFSKNWLAARPSYCCIHPSICRLGHQWLINPHALARLLVDFNYFNLNSIEVQSTPISQANPQPPNPPNTNRQQPHLYWYIVVSQPAQNSQSQ